VNLKRRRTAREGMVSWMALGATSKPSPRMKINLINKINIYDIRND
jgi:hypothetical protein